MGPTTIEEILVCLVSTAFHRGNLELPRAAAATATAQRPTACARVWFASDSTKQSDNWDIDQSHEEMPTVCAPRRSVRSGPPSLSLSCQLITPGKAQNVGPLSAVIRPANRNVPQLSSFEAFRQLAK